MFQIDRECTINPKQKGVDALMYGVYFRNVASWLSLLIRLHEVIRLIIRVCYTSFEKKQSKLLHDLRRKHLFAMCNNKYRMETKVVVIDIAKEIKRKNDENIFMSITVIIFSRKARKTLNSQVRDVSCNIHTLFRQSSRKSSINDGAHGICFSSHVHVHFLKLWGDLFFIIQS